MTSTVSTPSEAIVGVFASHMEAETAVKALRNAGIDMHSLSIMGKNYQTSEHPIGFYTSGDRMMFWGGQGAFWGSLWGLLFGGAMFLIPGIGPIVAMGPIVGWIAGALEGAVVGGAAGVLAGALASVGVPEDQIVKYETQLKAGKFLVLAHGTIGDLQLAHRVLGTGVAASPAA